MLAFLLTVFGVYLHNRSRQSRDVVGDERAKGTNPMSGMKRALALLNLPADASSAAIDAAVRAFQTANHLSVDGIVGPRTWEALTKTPKWFQALDEKLTSATASAGVPLGLAVGWIEKESGGNLHSTTSLNEKGYFQILPNESKDLGFDHNRLGTDADYSIASGLKLVNHYASRVKALGLGLEGELAWRMVKFLHSIGSGAAKTVLQEASAAGVLDSWSSFRDYVTANDSSYTSRLKHSPLKWVKMVDEVFNVAPQLGVA